MNIRKGFVVIVFTLGIAVGLYVANSNLSLIYSCGGAVETRQASDFSD